MKAGDIVARLENDELDADIEQLEYDLQTAQQEVRATQTHTQYVYKELYDEDGDLRYDVNTWEPLLGQFSNEITIRAPADGLIKAIYIEKGDDALAVYRRYGAVMMISTDGKMKVELSGLSGEALELGRRSSSKAAMWRRRHGRQPDPAWHGGDGRGRQRRIRYGHPRNGVCAGREDDRRGHA